MAWGVHVRYVAGGKLYPCRLDYPTKAQADAVAAMLMVSGFWFQRPDDPTAYGFTQKIANTNVRKVT